MTRACKTLTLLLVLPMPRPLTAFYQNPFLHSRLVVPKISISSTVAAGTELRYYGCSQPLGRSLRRRRHSSLRVVAASSRKAGESVAPMEGDARRAAQHDEPPRKRKTTRKRLTSTGGLKSLPIVTPSVELLAHATSRSKKVGQDMLIKNARNRSRKWTAERMDALGKAVSKPLGDIIRQYEYQLPILHPFEATLADLTVRAREKSGERTLQSILDSVNNFRKDALQIGKAAAMEGKRGSKKLDIMKTMDEGYAKMEEHFLTRGHVIEDLTAVQKSLRNLPIVQLQLPTVVLVGAPNVGKSSIVRTVSTGTPEVNSYPFTTRGMSLGHMFHPQTKNRYQIMDTPGVLSRPDGERNEMEALTLASMQHLPTAVVFVMDLSGLSGNQSSLEKQIEVRHELRRRFPRRPWLDVVSKADLPRIGLEEARLALPEGYLDLSTEDGTGVEELKERLFGMFEIIEKILQPPPDIQG